MPIDEPPVSDDAPVRTLDFSAHFYPPDIYEEYSDHPPVSPALSDIEVLEDWYDRGGVDRAALSQPLFMGHDDLEATARANDALLEAIDGRDRFLGLAAVPTAAGGDAAAGELERCLEAGYSGGALPTSAGGVALTDEALAPVFAAAERTGAPLLVHPKLDESLHPAVFRTHRLNGIFGREAALAASICTVVHEGVLDRHPDLVLVYHHSGGNIASAMGRLHNQLDPGRWPHGDTAVYDDAEHLEPFETFKRTIEERIYLDTAGYHGYHQPLAAMLSEFPASQVLLGSDGPIETRTPEELADMVEAVGEVTSGTDSRRILGENALALLVNR